MFGDDWTGEEAAPTRDWTIPVDIRMAAELRFQDVASEIRRRCEAEEIKAFVMHESGGDFTPLRPRDWRMPKTKLTDLVRSCQTYLPNTKNSIREYWIYLDPTGLKNAVDSLAKKRAKAHKTDGVFEFLEELYSESRKPPSLTNDKIHEQYLAWCKSHDPPYLNPAALETFRKALPTYWRSSKARTK